MRFSLICQILSSVLFFVVRESTAEECFAKVDWNPLSECRRCENVTANQCASSRFTPCYATYEDCMGAKPICYAKLDWQPSSDCKLCEVVQDNQCKSTNWTRCFSTYEECKNGRKTTTTTPPTTTTPHSLTVHSTFPAVTSVPPETRSSSDTVSTPKTAPSSSLTSSTLETAPSSSVTRSTQSSGSTSFTPSATASTDASSTVTSPTSTTSTHFTLPVPTSTTSTDANSTTWTPGSTSSTNATSMSNSTSATNATESANTCWAASDWSWYATCEVCQAPQFNQCPAFTYTTCYPTIDGCLKSLPSAGTGAFCSKNCQANSLNITRPIYSGASCYETNADGSQFGPSWTPAGRTPFEKVVKSPTELHHLINQYKVAEVPQLNSSELTGCDAATLVYENIVCALELIAAKKLVFSGPNGQTTNISEFANNGDSLIDKLEVAAFISHKLKETGGLAAWEEAGGEYAQPDTQFPPYPGAEYHGRGPIQISWNYNYGPFSEWFYGDKNILLKSPEKVDSEGPMGFIAAFWFWFTPRDFQGAWYDSNNQKIFGGTLRTRDAIVHWTDGKLTGIYNDGKDYSGGAGLSLSTNVINGGIECNTEDKTPASWRISYFLATAERLGVMIPHLDDPAACLKDKLCRGLFVGCHAVHKGLSCKGQKTGCGVTYVNNWVNPLCE